MAGLGTYLDIVNPYKFQETIARESKSPNRQGTLMNAVIIGVIFTCYNFLTMYIRTSRFGVYTFTPQNNSILNAFNTVGTPLDAIVTFLLGIFSFYLASFLFHGIAKILGGNGKFDNFAWPNSLILVPIQLVYSISLVIALASPQAILCCLIVVIPLLSLIYSFFLGYKAVRAVHTSLSRNRAIITVIAGVILYYIVMIVLIYARAIVRI